MTARTPDPVRLFDFDRTLFDTGRFVEWLWGCLAMTYGIDAAVEKQRAKEFYDYDGEWYDYRFFDHIASLPAIAEPVDDFCQRCRDNAPEDFLFPDAAGVLGDIDGILTFGNEAYQRFKLSFAPRLKDMPVPAF